MDTWLIWKLTGGTNGGQFVTDVSNAARTNLMDIRTRQWHAKTCRLFGLEPGMLADIKSNAEVFGHVREGPLQGEGLDCYHALTCRSWIYKRAQKHVLYRLYIWLSAL